MKLSYLKTIFVAAAVSAMSVNAGAEDMHWRYKYGSTDDNGANGGNWRDSAGNLLNRAPTSEDNVIFDSYDPVSGDGGTQVSNRMHTQAFEFNVANILFDFDSTKGSPSSGIFQVTAVRNTGNNFTVTGGVTVKGDKDIVFVPEKANEPANHGWKSIDLGYISVENSRALRFENCCANIKLNAVYNESKGQWESIGDLFTNDIAEGSTIVFQGKGFESSGQKVKAAMGSTNNYGTINIWANTEFIGAGDNFNNYGKIIVVQNSQYAGNQALSGVINNKAGGTISIDNNTSDNIINAVINNEGTLGSNTNAGKMVFTNGSKINNIGGYINLNAAGIDFQEGSSLYSKTSSRVVFNAKTNAAHFSTFEVYGSGEKNTTIDKDARYVDIYGTNVSFDNLTIGGGFSRYSKDIETPTAKAVDHMFYVSDAGAFSAKNITILTNLVSSENEANGITENYSQIRSNGGPATIENLTFQGGESADAKTYRVAEFRINTGKKDYGDGYALTIDKINVLGYAKQSHFLSTFSTVSAKIGTLNIEDGISVCDNGIGDEGFTGTNLLVEKVTGNVRTTNSSEVAGHQGVTVNDISLTNAMDSARQIYFNVRGTKSVEIDTVNAVVRNSLGNGGDIYAWTEENTKTGISAGAVHIRNVKLDTNSRLHIGSVGTSELNGYTGYSHLDNVDLGNGGMLEFAFKDRGTSDAILQKTANIGNLNGYGKIGLDGNADWITYTVNLNGSGKYTGEIADSINKAALVMNIVKNGSGTQILSGNNTYKGTTNVNEGTLLMNRTDGKSTIYVRNGATFGAAGQGVSASYIVKDSGGSLLFDFSMGDVSLNLLDGSRLKGEILSTDFIFSNIAGILNKDTLLFSFADEESITNASLREILNSGLTYTYIDKATGQQYTANFTEGEADGSMYVTFEVPEPATWAAIFGALALALAIYRRRK